MPLALPDRPLLLLFFHLLSSNDVPQASPLSFNFVTCESNKSVATEIEVYAIIYLFFNVLS